MTLSISKNSLERSLFRSSWIWLVSLLGLVLLLGCIGDIWQQNSPPVVESKTIAELSTRARPKTLLPYYGPAYAKPANIKFEELGPFGKPQHWYSMPTFWLEGYKIDRTVRAPEKEFYLHVFRDKPVDQPPSYQGFYISQVWDANYWDGEPIEVLVRASFRGPSRKGYAKESTASIRIISLPKNGRDPSMRELRIDPKKEGVESYQMKVETKDIDWLACYITMTGDGELTMSGLSIAPLGKEPADSNISAEPKRSPAKSSNGYTGFLAIALAAGALASWATWLRDGWSRIKTVVTDIKITSQRFLEHTFHGSCFERSDKRWHRLSLFGFRTIFAYLIGIPLVWMVMRVFFGSFSDRWLQFQIWLAGKLGLEVKVFEGITMGNAIDATQILISSIVSLVFAGAWTLLTPRTANHERLHEMTRWLTRYTLFLMLLPYGTSKIFLAQFPKPSGATLTVTLEKLTPGNLMWAFFGTSDAFNLIAGGLECLACLLILFRRTTLIGSLLAFGLLTQITIMDLCYGVEVAFHALGMTILAAVLIAPDAHRLICCMLGWETSPASPSKPFLSQPWQWLGTRVLKLFFIGMFCFNVGLFDYRRGAFGKKPNAELGVIGTLS
jgi:hypothetical protein